MPTIAFKTLGCRLNQADTDQLAADFISLGFSIVDESESPDVIVINSCTVTQEATRASRKTAARSSQNHPRALVVMAGCYPSADRDEASASKGVAMTATNQEKDRLAAMVAEKLGVAAERPDLLQIQKMSPDLRGFPGADRTRVNLRVQTGCDEFCSFCIIPFTRGPLRSHPLEELISQAREKVGAGTRELVLTGVHLGKYGWDEGWGQEAKPDDALLSLLDGLLGIDGLERIRLSSILSRHLTPRVIRLIRDEPRVCRFLHVPLQAGDDEVLSRMNRPYRIGDYLDAVEQAQAEIDQLAISTDVIVGFPGETPRQFESTLEIVESVGYMKLHVFRYSPRSGTPSASWEDQIPEDEKRRRSRELIALGNRLRESFHQRFIGASVEVLVEEAFEDSSVVGHTDNFVKVRFEGSDSMVDQLARVRVREASVESVRGEFEHDVPWENADPRGISGTAILV